MKDYIKNIENRKFKKNILNFLSRIGFGAGRLPFSGRIILVLVGLLFLTLFMPWMEIQFVAEQKLQTYNAFSRFMGHIGIGIIIAAIIIPFFLLSHIKKEQVRAYIPFRLSDTQAIIFIASMLLVAIVQILLISSAFESIGKIHFRFGFGIAGACISGIIFSGYFLSKRIKKENTESYYLDKDNEAIL